MSQLVEYNSTINIDHCVESLMAINQGQMSDLTQARNHVDEFLGILEVILLNDEKSCHSLSNSLVQCQNLYYQLLEDLKDTRSEQEHKSDIQELFAELPTIKELIKADIKAAFEGDPAARSVKEVIISYPSIRALLCHRVAHLFYKANVPLLPRFISEISHTRTGIDIHPGASVGRGCFLDHGTGIVVGETAIIGNFCRIYQGVTLGSKSFPQNADGSLVKSINRHPIVGDHVVIYAGATILGRISIGNHAVIGGNVWVTDSVAPYTKISQTRYQEKYFMDGEGI